MTLYESINKSYQGLKGLVPQSGENKMYYKIKFKDVAVSTWSTKSVPYREYGVTTLKALLGDFANILPDTYTTKEAIKTEIKKGE